MRSSLKLSLLTLLLFPLLLCAAHFAWAQPGFFRLNHAEVPEAVRRAYRGVVRIENPSHRFDFTAGAPDATEMKEELRRLKLSLPLLRAEFGQHAPHLEQLERELRQCETQKKCTISTGGTGFFARNNRTLITAFHVLRPSLELMLGESFWDFDDSGKDLLSVQQRRTHVQNLKLKIRLFDASGKLVFGNRPSDWAQIERIEDQVLADLVDWSEPQWAHDQLVLRLSRPIPSVAPLAAEMDPELGTSADLAVGAKVFALGFPVASVDRAPNNSDGRSFRVSMGSLISAFDLSTFGWTDREKTQFLSTEDGRRAQHIVPESGQLSAKSDCFPQMSGGPVLTATGIVIGVLIGSQPGGSTDWSPERRCVFSQLR